MFMLIFFFKQKTAYEMRISDWSSDVCSSDLPYHVRDREIDNRQPDDAEDHCGREFQPLDDGAQNQCGGNRSEGHLETHEHIFGNDDAISEGGRRAVGR